MDILKNASGPGACWSCGGQVGRDDNYCRHCGRGLGGRAGWYYKPWGIIALTVVALGPFSLYYLWRSPSIPGRHKWGYAAGIIAFSYFVIERFIAFWRVYLDALGGLPM